MNPTQADYLEMQARLDKGRKRAVPAPQMPPGRVLTPNSDNRTPKTDFNHEIDHKTQSSVAKQAVWDEPLAAEERKAGNASRISISVVSYRRRLLDPDNLCPKYFIDCLRYAEIIKDDSPEFITLQTSQIKVKMEDDERTEITVE